MSTDQPVGSAPAEPSPALRARLQKLFEHAVRKLQADDIAYATDLLQECVQGDPTNNVYAQNYMTAVKKKFTKKGIKPSALRASGLRSQVRAAQKKKDWSTVISTGTEGLKQNPWDMGILMAMGEACQHLKSEDCELTYLHTAREAHPKDLDLNRQCAKALTRRGLYDQAIYCWHAVERERPEDLEALTAIAELSVERTKHKGNPIQQRKDDGPKRDVQIALTPEQKLEQALIDNPAFLDGYIELADLYAKGGDKLDRAERVLRRGLEASGNELRFQEKLEDVLLATERRRVGIAERRAGELGTDDARELAKRLKQELSHREMEFHRTRSERYPEVAIHKYEVGHRLKKEGQYADAAPWLQGAVGDPRCGPAAQLDLGECLQYQKQYEPALATYQAAVAGYGSCHNEGGKLALYRAGCLAMGMKQFDVAKQSLRRLFEIDPAYRDVKDRLDKLA